MEAALGPQVGLWPERGATGIIALDYGTMRGFFILSALSASIVVASGQSGHAPTAAPQPANPPPPQLLSPDKEGSANVQNAAEAPLHDLNLVRQKIPPVLLAALADPYARPRPFNCRTIVADVEGLREALGGEPLVELIVHDSHTCYLGAREPMHDWGAGCGTCPACELRAKGWNEWVEAGRPALAQ